MGASITPGEGAHRITLGDLPRGGVGSSQPRWCFADEGIEEVVFVGRTFWD